MENSIEAFKDLDKKEMELKIQINQLSTELTNSVNKLNEKAQSNEINPELLTIYNSLLTIINSGTMTPEQLQQCDNIEQQLLKLQTDIINTYNQLEQDITNLTS